MYDRILAAISAGVLAALTSTSAFAQFHPRYSETLRGDLVLIGNTLAQDCAPGVPLPVVGIVGACGASTTDSAADVYWRSDIPSTGQAEATLGVTSVQARSTAVLSIPAGATVEAAYLYWAGSSPLGLVEDRDVVLERPGVFSTDVDATECYATGIAYQCVADVTHFVQVEGPGAFRVGGVTARDLTNANTSVEFAGWAMAVVYSSPALALRSVQVHDGFDRVQPELSANVIVTAGFVVPPAGYDARSFVVAYEGDNTFTGESYFANALQVSNALNPADNPFNSTRSYLGAAVSVAGDLPQLAGTVGSMSGVDIDVFDLTGAIGAGSTAVVHDISTASDEFYLGVLGFSVSTLAPQFTTSFLTAIDRNDSPLRTDDVVSMPAAVVNSGNDASINTTYSVTLPAGVEYVPGTLQIGAGPNVGAKSDAPGDDQAEYVAATREIVFRLGTGANGATGGVLGVGASSAVTFDVVVSAVSGDEVSVQGGITAAGQLGAWVTLTPTDNDGLSPLAEPTVLRVEECRGDSDCVGETPYCDRRGAPACVQCATDFDCGESAPVCDPASRACRGCALNEECGVDAPVCLESGACGVCSPDDTSFCPDELQACDELPNRCVECTDETDCGGATPYCDRFANVCVTCATNFDCFGSEPICSGGSCRGCDSPGDCIGSGLPVCDETGACVACNSFDSSACGGETPLCNTEQKVCAECVSGTDCGGNTPICLLFGRCAPCSDDSQCGSGVCLDSGACGECTADDTSGCAESEPFCLEPGALCVGCRDNLDCGELAPVCNPSTFVCELCDSDADCTGTATACQPDGTCGECSATNLTACGGAVPTCNEAVGACVECTDGHQASCAATCGDGVRVDVREQCDDGNTDDLDGCSATCLEEAGYSCIDVTGWLSSCTSSCGDGAVAVGAETCDDANSAADDGCDACVVSNGYVCTGEPSLCSLLAECGDYTVDDGEACDDGNTDAGDGCDALCAEESGYLCTGSPSECREDADGDDVADVDDVCPEVSDDQADGDSDGFGDACDGCPDEAAPASVDGCLLSQGDDEPGFDTGGEDTGESDATDDTGGTDASEDAASADAAGDDTSAGGDAGEDGGEADATAGEDSGAGGGGGGGGAGGCAAAGHSPATGLGAALFGLALVVARRRRAAGAAQR